MDKEYKQAVELYQKILNEINIKEEDCSMFENEEHPMNPNMYFQLSQVRGFNELNGIDYSSYIKEWKNKYNLAKEGRKMMSNITNDEYMYTLFTC